MRVSITRVYTELLYHLCPESSVRYHTLYGILDYPGRIGLHHLLHVNAFQSAGISGMPVIEFLLGFIPCNPDFLGIDNDDVIAGIEMPRIYRLVFAHEQPG